MLETINMYIKITCDKCGRSQTELLAGSNETFYHDGWTMNRNAKKYIHKCYNCLTARERKSRDFVINKFP